VSKAEIGAAVVGIGDADSGGGAEASDGGGGAVAAAVVGGPTVEIPDIMVADTRLSGLLLRRA